MTMIKSDVINSPIQQDLTVTLMKLHFGNPIEFLLRFIKHSLFNK